MKRIIVFFIALCCATNLLADPGEAGYDFLRRDLCATSVALGSATVAFPQITSFGGNPALLSYRTKQSLATGYIDYPLDLKAGFIAASKSWRGMVAAARIGYFDYGSFDRMTTTGQKTGTFGASDIHLVGGLAGAWRGLGWGAELGLLHSKIDSYTSSVLTGATGIVYEPPFMSQTKVGAAIKNFGFVMKKYDASDTKLPVAIDVGGSKKLEHLPLTLMVQLTKWSDSDVYFTGAGEFDIAASFKFRTGYSTLGADQKVAGTSDAIAGFSAGFGLTLRDYQFDFAYAFQGALGDRLYLQLNWFPPTPPGAD